MKRLLLILFLVVGLCGCGPTEDKEIKEIKKRIAETEREGIYLSGKIVGYLDCMVDKCEEEGEYKNRLIRARKLAEELARREKENILQ